MVTRRGISAGILLYRRTTGEVEVFLAHPGGPFWQNRDAGAWTIPKGLIDEGEDPLQAARREFLEETGLDLDGPCFPLGDVRQKAGKIVHAWACEGDADPATVRSNEVQIEWPPRSGRWRSYPEVDRCAWYPVDLARSKINPAQAEFIDRLLTALASE